MSKRLFSVEANGALTVSELGGSLRPLAKADGLLPAQISGLHQQFARWETANLSPGPVTQDRIWVGPAGELAVAFSAGSQPRPLGHVGLAPDLAAWFVLLDRYMETFVVIARARSVWTPAQLAQALTFTTPSLLPPPSPGNPAPDNWLRVAQTLAAAIADGPLARKKGSVAGGG